MQNSAASLPDAERSRHRLEIFNQLFRGLLLVDGGGIVALLAYLQAVQDNVVASKIILICILFLSISLLMALLFMKYRYETSEHDQFKTGNAISSKRKERRCLNLSIGLVFFAMLTLVIGLMLFL